MASAGCNSICESGVVVKLGHPGWPSCPTRGLVAVTQSSTPLARLSILVDTCGEFTREMSSIH